MTSSVLTNEASSLRSGRDVDSGVVDEHRRRPVLADDLVRGRAQGAAVGDVRLDDAFARAHVEADDGRPRARERRGPDRAEVSERSGDDGDAAREGLSAHRRRATGTDAGSSASGSSSSRCSNVSAASSSSGCRSVRPITLSSSYGGRPSPGDFSARSSRRSVCPTGSVAAATIFLPIFVIGSDLARIRRLRPVAEGDARAPEVADELAQADRLEREAVVGALHRAVEREVLLDDARAEHVGRDRHRDAAVVPGVADDGVGEELPVGVDHAQVELLPLGRVAGGALEDRDLRVDLGDRLVRAPDVVERAAAGGDDHRLADLGDGAEQRRVRQVAGGDLVRRHVEVGEKLGAREVERGREEGDAELRRERLQLLVLGAAELERLAV